MELLSRLKEKAMDSLGLGPEQQSGDAVLDKHEAVLNEQSALLDKFRTTCISYSRGVMAMADASAKLSESFVEFYAPSATHSVTPKAFKQSQLEMDRFAQKNFKEQFSFGWSILAAIDDWAGGISKLRDHIQQTRKMKKRVAELTTLLSQLSSEKAKRVARGLDLTEREQQMVTEYDSKLTKASLALQTMSASIDKNIRSLVDGRFERMDQIFYRLVELQADYLRTSHNLSASYQPAIDAFRKTHPKETVNSNGHNSDSSPVAVHSPGNEISSPSRDNTAVIPESRPPRAEKPVPAPAPAREPAPASAQRSSASSPAPAVDVFGNLDNAFASTTPSRPSASPASTGGAGFIDIFGAELSPSAPSKTAPAIPTKAAATPSSAARSSTSSPVPDNSNNSGNNSSNNAFGDILGFGASSPATSKLNVPPRASQAAPSPRAEPSPAAFDMDMGSIFGTASPPVARSTTASPQPPASSAKAASVMDFDIFATSSAKTSSAPSPAAAGTSPPTAAAGARSSGTSPVSQSFREVAGNAQDLKRLIADNQAEELANIRRREIDLENLRDAMRESEAQLDDKLKAWEFKNGQRKNIRTLLTSMHTILWANSGWRPMSVVDLMDQNKVRKAYHVASRLVHPDKVEKETPEVKVVARRAFEALNAAFVQFREDPNAQ